jgi:hypothetical protein
MSNKTFEPAFTVSKRHFLPSIFLLLLTIGLLKPALATEASKIPMTASRWQTKGDAASIPQASTADHQAIETLLGRHRTIHPTCANTKAFANLSSPVASGFDKGSTTFASNNTARWRRSRSTS